MTLLYFDGFQDVNLMPKPGFAPSASIGVTTGRDGSTNGALSMTNSRSVTITLPSAAATCITGQAINCVDNPSGTMLLMKWANGGTVQLVICLTSAGYIELRQGTNASGTLLATSSGHPPVLPAVWRHIQCKVVLHTSAGSAVIKLDGVTVINYSGATSAASVSVDTVSWTANFATASVFLMDDFWVCDAVDATASQGRPNNDFLGDLAVKTMLPTSDGAEAQMTCSTGTNHSALVDEVPPNTTDYVSSATAAQKDLYNVTDLANVANVFAIKNCLYAVKTDAGARSLKSRIRENSTSTSEASGQPLSTTYATYVQQLFKRPSDSALFTASDLTSLQAGVEVV